MNIEDTFLKIKTPEINRPIGLNPDKNTKVAKVTETKEVDVAQIQNLRTEILTALGDKKVILDAVRKKVENATDAVGHPIEVGIKETVVMFNAFELPTTQSCEGHIDLETRSGPRQTMGPWVEIYPEEPTQEGWQNDDELRRKVEEESDRYLAKATTLLNEFYANREVFGDEKIGTEPMAYGFRVQSSGLEKLKNPNDKNQQEKGKIYQKEMERFTLFLKEKFLS